MKLNPVVKPIAFLVCLMAFGVATGLSSDRDQPIEIEADFAELDDIQRVAVYKGNVVVTRGSIRLTGDILTVNYTPDHEMQDVVLIGRPARFRQRPDNADVDTEGEAIKIEYRAQDNLLYLIEDAKVIQRKQIYTGYRMEYDTKRSLLTMKKAAPNEVTPSGEKLPSGGGRVKIIIPPKKKGED
ncbi:MAG: lipopolysaccharide transport periplasmic protein LptA [Nitrososphaera sp.]